MGLEFYVLILMLVAFALAVFLGKFPIGVSLAISSILGALVAGYGFPLRHLVEGTFAYLDPILIIASADILSLFLFPNRRFQTFNFLTCQCVVELLGSSHQHLP